MSPLPDLLLHNVGFLVTVSSENPVVHRDVSIVISGSEICDVIPVRTISRVDARVTIDCSGLIAIPGLVNAHHHMYQTCLRGVGALDNLGGWFRSRERFLKHVGPEERFHSVSLAHLELLENGTTCVCEFGSNNRDPESIDSTIEALNDSLLALVLAYAPPPGAAEDLTRIHSTLEASSRLRRLLCIPGPVAPSVHDAPAMKEFSATSEVANTLGVGISTHILESQGDVAGRPVDALRQLGCLNEHTLLAHMVHASDSDIATVAAADAAVVHNPLSNMRLASGVINLPAVRGAGIRVGLGTDGACNDAADMFETMKVAMGLQRATTRDPLSCTPYDALRMATREGAAALGLGTITGSIEAGKRADIVLIDPDSAGFTVVNDPVAQVVLNTTPSEVRHVIAAGEVVKRDFTVVAVDPNEVRRSARDCFREFADRVRPLEREI